MSTGPRLREERPGEGAAGPVSAAESRRGELVPAAMVLAGIASIQIGSGIATHLFDEIGPGGAVLYRALVAAAVLTAVWRPTLRLSRQTLLVTVVFGVSLAVMNLCFYEAIDRIPLGVAVTLEFIGPLGVAIIATHRRADLVWAAMAAVGILLLTGGISGGSVDAFGIGLALLAGVFWGVYIVFGRSVGRHFEGGQGLAIGMAISMVLVMPFGIAEGGARLLAPGVIALGLAVGVLSSLVPYSLEMEAMRRIHPSAFGVMMSIEPAVAALVGLVLLGQGLGADEIVAIGLVVVASAGALRSNRTPPPLEA